MKLKLVCILFLASASFCHAQYTKENLVTIITNGSSKTWIDKNSSRTYAFNKDMHAELKTGAASIPVAWNLSTTDNLTWKLAIGKETYELIISYNKEGKQYLKLVQYTGGNKATGYKEIKLFAVE